MPQPVIVLADEAFFEGENNLARNSAHIFIAVNPAIASERTIRRQEPVIVLYRREVEIVGE